MSKTDKAVIFDMDGVIFDSERLICDIWIDIATENNMVNMEKLMIDCVGLNDKATEEKFKEQYGEDYDYSYFKKISSKRYHDLADGGKLPKKPGVNELLEFLKENGYKTALASSTRVEVVTNQLREAGLIQYFDFIIGGDMVSHSKPDPEIFLKAADGIEVDITTAYIVEDSFNGIRAAYSAGAKPIMVPDMIEPDDEMREKSLIILKDLLEVRDYLKANID